MRDRPGTGLFTTMLPLQSFLTSSFPPPRTQDGDRNISGGSDSSLFCFNRRRQLRLPVMTFIDNPSIIETPRRTATIQSRRKRSRSEIQFNELRAARRSGPSFLLLNN
jgi:hypothetical protein